MQQWWGRGEQRPRNHFNVSYFCEVSNYAIQASFWFYTHFDTKENPIQSRLKYDFYGLQFQNDYGILFWRQAWVLKERALLWKLYTEMIQSNFNLHEDYQSEN